MEGTKHAHIGRLKENDLNPTEKILEILRLENFEKLLHLVQKSENTVEALNESFIPLRK